ncbi:MAG: polysaccharide biosynthesis/export family protein [Pseudomonadota bacterium]|nr:polysaccharide biosynthesis/export family protein [Pseudomonadota bacterium]
MKKIAIMILMMASSLTMAADNLVDNGDLVRVSVYGNPDLTTEVKVTESGTVNFPLLGEVKIGGLSAPDAEQKISQRLISDGFLKQAQVNIIVLQSSGQQVSVLGQVSKPGKYSLETGAKYMFDFVALSGGVSAKGSDVITIIRMNENPPKRIAINVNKLLLKSDAGQINSANLEMQAGDIIYVPEAPVFYVYGSASRPGLYRFKPGMIVAQAIAASGGVSLRGTMNGITIKRKNVSGEFKEVEADISTVIYADDIIFIPESLF